MKKRIAFLLAAAMLITSLAGCGGNHSSADAPAADSGASTPAADNSTPEAPKDDGKTYTFSMGSPQPLTSPLGQGGTKFCELVAERTDGKVTINYFPSSAIGSERDCLTQIAGNELEFELAGVTTIDMFAPEFGFLQAPYLLTGMDHLMNMMDGEIGDKFKAKLLENNVNMLAVARVGVRQLTSNREIKSIDDLAGLKLRLPEIATWNKVWSHLGAAPVAIATAERYNALQTGVAEASEGTWDQVIDYNLYEVQKYAIETNHVCEFGAIYASEKLLQTLPEDLRKTVEECAVEAMDYSSELSQKAVEESLEKMEGFGLVPSKIDTTEFNRLALEACEEYFNTTWTVATKDEIMSYAD